MNRRAIIIATSVIVVAGIVAVLASYGDRNGTPPASACNFAVSMPVSNLTAASQTNISPQTK